MVDYNAFNVDPLRYQQAAMGNLTNAYQMRDQNAYRQAYLDQQAKQDSELNAYRKEQNRIRQDELDQKTSQQKLEKMAKAWHWIDNAKTIEGKKNRLSVAGKMFDLGDDSFNADYIDEDPKKSTILYKGTKWGDMLITAPTGNIGRAFKAISDYGEDQEGLSAMLKQLGVEMKPYEDKDKEDGYTLKEGDKRFDKNNNLVAEGGKKTGDERSPYYQAVQTSSGVQILNSREGTITPATGPDGKPLLPVTADPSLAGAKTAAQEKSKKDVEKEYLFPKVRDTMSSLNMQWDNVDKYIDKALEQIGPFTAGAGSYLSNIPGTPQKNLQQTLATIQANIGFDKLQEMRANSPTGGALGQVSDMENKLLQAVKGSMDQSQSPSQLIENLKSIKSDLAALRKMKNKAYKNDFGKFMDIPDENGSPRTADDYLKSLGIQ